MGQVDFAPIALISVPSLHPPSVFSLTPDDVAASERVQAT
jgi:hypothetical protein